MKMNKKMLLGVTMLACVALSACGTSEENKNDSENTKSENFTYMMHSKFVDWLEEDNWYDVAKEKTGISPEFVKGADNDDDYYAAVDQKLISKTFPDSGIVNLSQARVYGEQGAFIDLKPYIEKDAPNIKKYIEEHPDYEKLITSKDGKIYGIVSEAPRFADFIFYRKDHFEKAGIEKVPTTIDELTDAMVKLKAYYGKDDPNYYPMSGREGYIRFQSAFLAQANYDNGISNGIYENGKVGTDLFSPGYKKMVEWYADLYKKGLIDPEWVDGSSTEEAWESKMLTGKASIAYDYLTRPSWFMQNGGPDNDPDYEIAVMPYLKDLNGDPSVQTTETQYNTLRAMVINNESEDKAEEIIKYLDFYFSDEGQTLVSWGVENKTFEEKDGDKSFIIDFNEEENKPAGEKRWSFLNDRLTFPKPIDNDAFYQWNDDLVKDAASELFTDENLKTGISVIYDADQSKKLSDLTAKVSESSLAGVTKFVKGERDMSEWDSFLKEMEDAGYKEIVEIQQEAYDETYK